MVETFLAFVVGPAFPLLRTMPNILSLALSIVHRSFPPNSLGAFWGISRILTVGTTAAVVLGAKK